VCLNHVTVLWVRETFPICRRENLQQVSVFTHVTCLVSLFGHRKPLVHGSSCKWYLSAGARDSLSWEIFLSFWKRKPYGQPLASLVEVISTGPQCLCREEGDAVGRRAERRLGTRLGYQYGDATMLWAVEFGMRVHYKNLVTKKRLLVSPCRPACNNSTPKFHDCTKICRHCTRFR
jgi:hypothetical protein